LASAYVYKIPIVLTILMDLFVTQLPKLAFLHVVMVLDATVVPHLVVLLVFQIVDVKFLVTVLILKLLVASVILKLEFVLLALLMPIVLDLHSDLSATPENVVALLKLNVPRTTTDQIASLLHQQLLEFADVTFLLTAQMLLSKFVDPTENAVVA